MLITAKEVILIVLFLVPGFFFEKGFLKESRFHGDDSHIRTVRWVIFSIIIHILSAPYSQSLWEKYNENSLNDSNIFAISFHLLCAITVIYNLGAIVGYFDAKSEFDRDSLKISNGGFIESTKNFLRKNVFFVFFKLTKYAVNIFFVDPSQVSFSSWDQFWEDIGGVNGFLRVKLKPSGKWVAGLWGKELRAYASDLDAGGADSTDGLYISVQVYVDEETGEFLLDEKRFVRYKYWALQVRKEDIELLEFRYFPPTREHNDQGLPQINCAEDSSKSRVLDVA